MDYIKLRRRRLGHWIGAPLIFSVFIPILILDIWLEVYHRICFKLYGIPYIKRSLYIKLDRHKLSYLKGYQKIGCIYCGYANGFAAYFVAIAAATEKYRCGIMHDKRKGFNTPKHHKDFVPYGDKKAFEEKYLP